MNTYSIRTDFTLAWDKLSSNVKSAIISISGFLLATGLLNLAKALFPSADMTQVAVVIITAFSSFLASFAKENIKV